MSLPTTSTLSSANQTEPTAAAHFSPPPHPSTSGEGNFHFGVEGIRACAAELLALAGATGTSPLPPLSPAESGLLIPTASLADVPLLSNPLLPQAVSEFIIAADEALAGQQVKVSELATYGTAAAEHLSALADVISDSENSSARRFEALG